MKYKRKGNKWLQIEGVVAREPSSRYVSVEFSQIPRDISNSQTNRLQVRQGLFKDSRAFRIRRRDARCSARCHVSLRFDCI